MKRCAKMSFETKSAAEKEIRVQRASPYVDRRLRAYQCPHCGLYHLTSWSRAKARYVLRKIAAQKRKQQAEESACQP